MKVIRKKANLMAEYNKGAVWWVVGYITHAELLELPQWDYERAIKAKDDTP